jgi:hypothetical protein
MLRCLSILLLPAVLMLTNPAPASAQYYRPGYYSGWRSVPGDYLAGRYANTSNGAACYVYRRANGYQFVNESGSWARFAYDGPNYLVQVAGQWDPTVVCNVTRDASGRTVLRFSSPNAAPGYWVKVY